MISISNYNSYLVYFLYVQHSNSDICTKYIIIIPIDHSALEYLICNII